VDRSKSLITSTVADLRVTDILPLTGNWSTTSPLSNHRVRTSRRNHNEWI